MYGVAHCVVNLIVRTSKVFLNWVEIIKKGTQIHQTNSGVKQRRHTEPCFIYILFTHSSKVTKLAQDGV